MNIFETKKFDNFINFLEKYYIAFLFLIMLTAGFNLFWNLGRFPIYSWDEARHGVNAYEMIKKNNFIVNTYSYKNDYWNLKPPVSYWAIIGGYKLIGFNALGLRFFSALSGILTIVIIAFFVLYKHGRLASLISAAVLSTTSPFIVEHCGRSGDADALFVLFFTLSVVSLALMYKNMKWVYVSGVFFSLAFLTKSWHAGNIVIIGGIYLILSRSSLKLKAKHLLILAVFCASPIIVWGILRYRQDKLTFFLFMIGYDLIARSTTTLENHIGDAYFYISILQGSYFQWLLTLSGSITASSLLLQTNTFKKESLNYVLLLISWIAVPFLLYTKAKTKISWYILPLYPVLAIVIGATVSFLLKCHRRNLILQLLLSFMVVFSIYKNENYIIKEITNPKIDYAQQLLKEIQNFPQYHGKKIYIQHFEQSYWLCAEFYGDLIPAGGGGAISDFLKDDSEDALLFITKDREEISEVRNYNFRIVLENEAAYIFSK